MAEPAGRGGAAVRRGDAVGGDRSAPEAVLRLDDSGSGAMKTPAARPLLLLAPRRVVLLLLLVAPQLLMLEASLGRRSAYGGIVHEWGVLNYLRALEPLYLRVLARSLGLALATTVVCLLVGYPMAYWLACGRPRRLAQRAAGPGDPAVLDELPGAHVRVGVPAAHRGPGQRSRSARIGLPALNLLYNDAAVLLGQVYGELPFMILPLYASLEKLDPLAARGRRRPGRRAPARVCGA